MRYRQGLKNEGVCTMQERVNEYRLAAAAKEIAITEKDALRMTYRDGLKLRLKGRKTLRDILIALGCQVKNKCCYQSTMLIMPIFSTCPNTFMVRLEEICSTSTWRQVITNHVGCLQTCGLAICRSSCKFFTDRLDTIKILSTLLK